MANQDTTLDLSMHDKPAMVAAVLFADIAGSTKLYDILGDTRAKQLIDETLSELRAATARFQGRVVKTIGDEIMCVFRDPERGMLAACDMQTRVNALPIVDGVKRLVRVGFHFGAVIEEKGDVFGDTVNVAARMAGVAKGLQIMTSRVTADQLPAAMRASVRPIASFVAVKGQGRHAGVRGDLAVRRRPHHDGRFAAFQPAGEKRRTGADPQRPRGGALR